MFRVAPNDRIAIDQIVQYIIQYNKSNPNNLISSIAVIYEKNSRYGELYKQYFQKAFEHINGKVINNKDPNQDECRISIGAAVAIDCMDKVAKNADALLLVPSTEKSVYLDDVINERNNIDKKRKLHLFGGDSMYKQPFLSQKTQGMVVAVPLANFTLNGLEMNWRAAMSYDATQALAKGVEMASIKCLSKSVQFDKCVRQELQSILSSASFKAKGILGNETVQFDNFGDRKIKDKLGVLVCVKHQGDQYIFKPLKPGELCS
ncbi:ABC transporter substrate-binding protein [Nostoc sp. FACHB-280]|uniref:ABC transporter substrate-binding protein n=1 Tax=Nostoc sp. FACHB-280 TaxID=2692839 RepID=UPI00168B921B|nr:ABC transporter substrate-binding protein [Nostoc sp. FACHB-280]MBD2497033.1 amino acid ABC transporter substrate-binding protein [Nostoc sp. FACHB-280]